MFFRPKQFDLHSEKLSLVTFASPHCDICQNAFKIIQSLEHLFSDKLEFTFVADGVGFKDEYALKGFPSTLVLKPNGEVVDRFIGGAHGAEEPFKLFIMKALIAAQDMPGIFTRMKNFFTFLYVAFRTAIVKRQIAAVPAMIESRQSICASCPKNDKGWCKGCGCHIETKTRLVASECPDKLW